MRPTRPRIPPAPGAMATGTPAALELGAPDLPVPDDETVAVPVLVVVVEAVSLVETEPV